MKNLLFINFMYIYSIILISGAQKVPAAHGGAHILGPLRPLICEILSMGSHQVTFFFFLRVYF